MTSTLNAVTSGLVSLAFALACLAATQIATVRASASSYVAPTYGSVMLDMGDEAL